jgi:hypothetical protein
VQQVCLESAILRNAASIFDVIRHGASARPTMNAQMPERIPTYGAAQTGTILVKSMYILSEILCLPVGTNTGLYA